MIYLAVLRLAPKKRKSAPTANPSPVITPAPFLVIPAPLGGSLTPPVTPPSASTRSSPVISPAPFAIPMHAPLGGSLTPPVTPPNNENELSETDKSSTESNNGDETLQQQQLPVSKTKHAPVSNFDTSEKTKQQKQKAKEQNKRISTHMQFFALTTTKEACVLFAYDLLLLTYPHSFFYYMISLFPNA